MSKKEKLATIGTFVVFIGTLIPIFLNEIRTFWWLIIIVIGFGFLVVGSMQPNRGNNQ